MVLELLCGSVNLPLQFGKLREVVIVECSRCEGPDAVVARNARMAPAEGVAAGQRHDVPVAEAHAAEHLSQALRRGHGVALV